MEILQTKADEAHLVYNLKDLFMNEEFAGDILNLSWNIYENLVLMDSTDNIIKCEIVVKLKSIGQLWIIFIHVF